jgi:hypothetical protein
VEIFGEHPLNINLEINNKRQAYKIDTVCVGVFVVGGGWTKEIKVREYGWWTSYTYMRKNNETSCNCFMWSVDGVEGERLCGWYNQNII